MMSSSNITMLNAMPTQDIPESISLKKLKEKVFVVLNELAKLKVENENRSTEVRTLEQQLAETKSALEAEKGVSASLKTSLEVAHELEQENIRKMKLWSNLGESQNNEEAQRLQELLESQKLEHSTLKASVLELQTEKRHWFAERQLLQEKIQQKVAECLEADKRCLALQETVEHAKIHSEEFDIIVGDIREKMLQIAARELNHKQMVDELEKENDSLKNQCITKVQEIQTLYDVQKQYSMSLLELEANFEAAKQQIEHLQTRLSDTQKDKQQLLDQLVTSSKISYSFDEYRENFLPRDKVPRNVTSDSTISSDYASPIEESEAKRTKISDSSIVSTYKTTVNTPLKLQHTPNYIMHSPRSRKEGRTYSILQLLQTPSKLPIPFHSGLQKRKHPSSDSIPSLSEPGELVQLFVDIKKTDASLTPSVVFLEIKPLQPKVLEKTVPPSIETNSTITSSSMHCKTINVQTSKSCIGPQ